MVDSDNREKALLDCIQKNFGVLDHRYTLTVPIKVHTTSEGDRTKILIYSTVLECLVEGDNE